MVDGGGDGNSSGYPASGGYTNPATGQSTGGYPASNGSYNGYGTGPVSPSCVGNVTAGAVMGASAGGAWAAMGAAAGAYTGGCFNGNGGY
ncbi:hypothetical protein [Vibrio parahaemolyticus]